MSQAENGVLQSDTDSGKVITFPLGIPGFETYTKYHIFHKQEKKSSVYWLESVDTPRVTFTLVDPTDYGLNYSLDLTDEEQEILQAEDPKLLAVLLMLSKKGEGGEGNSSLNANIAGPIILNLDKRLGLQKVIATARMDVNIVQA
ncbi:flagellar assembly protein FliW [Desulfosediminicola flagellatus]|uniref:flagellar assembly protein FliW n=1 Tax=Desulfosediminicola flagellatus TaxID=2569541 RepID=UPI0010AD9AAA|nr:flagellar assembly protein FliW [Desulfosediminicola flagellatus]